MPIPADRTIKPSNVRTFGQFGDAVDVPPLTDVQTRSYDRFLQLEAAYDERTPTGLEGVMRKSFPSKATTRKSAWSTSSTSWANPVTTRMNAGSFV